MSNPGPGAGETRRYHCFEARCADCGMAAPGDGLSCRGEIAVSDARYATLLAALQSAADALSAVGAHVPAERAREVLASEGSAHAV